MTSKVNPYMWTLQRVLYVCLCMLIAGTCIFTNAALSQVDTYAFNDSHLHITNYVQEGLYVRELLTVMGNIAGRATLFGIPLQQQWSYRVDGQRAPAYYLDTDSHL